MSVGYRTMSMAEMSTILRNLQRSLESLQSQVNSLSGGGGGIGGGATSHNLLSTTHSDTEADTVVQGDLIVGGATPTWERLALGASGTFLKSDGSDLNWATLQASDIDTLALLLDQTTPQTVVNGIPLLDKEYDDFSNPDEFVNKGYVDWVATAIGANYYMTDDTDGDTGYKICSLTPSAGSETYIEESGVTDGQLLGTWISDVGEAPSKLPRGMYDWFIFAEKTSGTKTLRLYWELYERKTDTSEVLIATSSESNELKMGEKTSYVVPLALDSDYTPDTGSRIVGKIYASVSGGGNAPTVKIYYQGASGSRWEIPSTTEILNNIYIKRDEIGIDDDDILQVDQAAGLTAGNLVRATSSGLESRTDAEILAQLSGKASAAFDWNGQDLDNIGDITATSLTIGSYYLDSLVANNKVPDSDKVDGYHLDQDVRTTASPSFAGLSLSGNLIGSSYSPIYAIKNLYLYKALGIDGIIIPYLTNSIYFLTKRGGSVSFSLSPSSGSAEYLFDGSESRLVFWSHGGSSISIEVTLDRKYKYHCIIGIHMDDNYYAKDITIEYYDPVDASWKNFSQATGNSEEYFCSSKNVGSNGLTKIKFTFSNYKNATYFSARQIFLLNYYWPSIKMGYLLRDGGVMYGGFDGNIGLGTFTFGTNANHVFAIANGTAPASSPADCFQMYSADQTAGNACPHFRTENGKVIKLYQQAHIADADGTLADITTKFNTLLSYLENIGLLATS